MLACDWKFLLTFALSCEEISCRLLRVLSVAVTLWDTYTEEEYVTKEGVLVYWSTNELLSIFPELENVVSVDKLITVATFCDVDAVKGKELETFATFTLDKGATTVLLDDTDSRLWLANASLVNRAKLSGSVNPTIENDDASSNDRTLAGTLVVLVVVVTNDSARVIGSVEPTTGKLED